MYKISVILPIFNVEDCSDTAMDSLINQSIGFENIEVILVDDCSTDNTPNIIKKYTEKYNNCKSIFLEENSGSAGKPRNTGIKQASADYLMFMDPDDEYTPKAFETFYNKIIDTEIDFVHSNWINDNYTSLQKTIYTFMKKDELFEFNGIENIINYHKYYRAGMCAAIYNKRFILDNDIFCTTELGEDLYFSILAIFKAKKVLFLADYSESYLNKIRDTEEHVSITNIRDIKHFTSRLRALYLLLDLLNSYSVEGNYYAVDRDFEVLIMQFYTLDPSIKLDKRKDLIKKIFEFEKNIKNNLRLRTFYKIFNYFIIKKHFKIGSLISKCTSYIYNSRIIRKIFVKVYKKYIKNMR